MTGVFTAIVLFCAAVSTVAWAIVKLRMENGKCRMKDCQQFSILHSKFSIHTAVFLFFAAIATVCAQKQGGGTNMVNCGNVGLWNYPSTNVALSAQSATLNKVKRV